MDDRNLVLDVRELPYIDSFTHLGHTLAKDCRINIDTQIKRMTYISKCNEVKETYNFLHPKEMQKIILTFCSAFYGSNLWDFKSKGVKQIYNLWNTMVRDVYGLSRMTRSYIMEQLLSVHHGFKVDILSHFQKFYWKLLQSPSQPIRVLAAMIQSNVCSVSEKNFAKISMEAGIDP